MWRSAFIILLLAGSPALAGQASAVMHVGITITGAAQTPAKANASSSSERAVAGSLGGARAAVVKPSARTRPRPPQ